MEQGYIYIDNNIFPTFLAISADEQSRGLMYIEPPTPIMSFVYDRPQINKFWMSNTPAPLDIVFCHDGKVSQICIGKPFSTSTIGDDKYSDLVIEFPLGTVEQSEIRVGQSVGLVKPTIAELKKFIYRNTKIS